MFYCWKIETLAISLALLCLAFQGVLSRAEANDATTRPNIMFIFADDK